VKNIVILGSTGSIGENALAVVRKFPDRLRVTGLAVNSSYKQALDQAEEFGVEHVAIADEKAAEKFRAEAGSKIKVYSGKNSAAELAGIDEADMVLCALVGIAGLKPVMRAVEAGTDVALATKEVLVSAGGIVSRACAESGTMILPVDSEHSALFQCLEGTGHGNTSAPGNAIEKNVRRLILTASGGPFAGRKDMDFDKVSVAEALNHPKWKMGKKVTVDSATLMNKGLEIMEAHWLFGTPIDRIKVVIHPESIVHSMVEFIDGSVIAQMSVPDMRFAIQYALLYPERADGELPGLNLADTGSLTFSDPDPERFPCLKLAREAAETGGTMPAVLNAANEVAVEKFLNGGIPFSGIWKTVGEVMKKHNTVSNADYEEIIKADRWARETAEGM